MLGMDLSECRIAMIFMSDWKMHELTWPVLYCAVWNDKCVRIKEIKVSQVLLSVNTFDKS